MFTGLLLIIIQHTAFSQLKFIIEDFEGLTEGVSDFKSNGLFTYGSIKGKTTTKTIGDGEYAGDRCISISKEGKESFGGWGKGIGVNIELDASQDNLNFYINCNENSIIKIELQEDDNSDNKYQKEFDDSWIYTQKLTNKNTWELISIPLNKFTDSNPGGDSIFNISYRQGKLFSFIISFTEPATVQKSTDKLKSVPVSENKPRWSFDFICFSKGKLPLGSRLFDPLIAQNSSRGCSLGAWSKEGNVANFTNIAFNFENYFHNGTNAKKLGVVHLFQPFAVDGGNKQNHYPSIERINDIIANGYIPMVTLEDHFVNLPPTAKQPNLYSIVEGHFDTFFSSWAKEIKQVDGTIFLRILHEFNGDWYPWCVSKNDNNPKLLIQAFQHIHTIFKTQQVTNVKFIWCPNSTSFPQEKWNFIMEAYPGDEYVDYVALDIYNGAGKGIPVWRSFRKEGIENYFTLTQRLPNKPLLVCETASRERRSNESSTGQNKDGWIKQMSQALGSDMSKIKLLTWFNEKESFKVTSSPEAQDAFLNHIMKNDYFKSGTKHITPLLRP